MRKITRVALSCAAALTCGVLAGCSSGHAISGSITIENTPSPVEVTAAPPTEETTPGTELAVDATPYTEAQQYAALTTAFEFNESLNNRDFYSWCSITTEFNENGTPYLTSEEPELTECAESAAINSIGVDLSGSTVAREDLLFSDDYDGWAWIESPDGALGVYVVKLTDGNVYVDVTSYE